MPSTWLLESWGDMSESDIPDGMGKLLEELSTRLGEPVMKSSQRLLIIIILWINGKMRFYELQSTLGIGKGSLSNHLDRLADNGIISMKDILTIAGPGKSIELTGKGREIMEQYSRIMSMILKNKES